MVLTLYIAGVLLTMNSDALACYAAKHKFNWKYSLMYSLLWPVTAPLNILGVIREQRKVTQDET